ncbi:hypothetical protein [Aquimarina sp. AU474]|uniref:hypothetical protein n=1 Tax=Aquimarina sp. AU474 TaxID=2108529 RepID=UPI000D68C6FC|nr:hypothetical protein [Aquimarina sp. AU474]
MKTTITGLLFMAVLFTFGQTKNQKQLERETNKVEIFTATEKDNLQVFVAEQVDKMKLSENLRDDYYMIVGYHTNKIGRLDDKDSPLSEKEIQTKFKKMITSLDADVKEILTEDQLKIHKESFEKIIVSVYNRRGWIKE